MFELRRDVPSLGLVGLFALLLLMLLISAWLVAAFNKEGSVSVGVWLALFFCAASIERLAKARQRTVPHWLKLDGQVLEWGIGVKVSRYAVHDVETMLFADEPEGGWWITFAVKGERKEVPYALVQMLRLSDIRLIADALFATRPATVTHGWGSGFSMTLKQRGMVQSSVH